MTVYEQGWLGQQTRFTYSIDVICVNAPTICLCDQYPHIRQEKQTYPTRKDAPDSCTLSNYTNWKFH